MRPGSPRRNNVAGLFGASGRRGPRTPPPPPAGFRSREWERHDSRTTRRAVGPTAVGRGGSGRCSLTERLPRTPSLGQRSRRPGWIRRLPVPPARHHSRIASPDTLGRRAPERAGRSRSRIRAKQLTLPRNARDSDGQQLPGGPHDGHAGMGYGSPHRPLAPRPPSVDGRVRTPRPMRKQGPDQRRFCLLTA